LLRATLEGGPSTETVALTPRSGEVEARPAKLSERLPTDDASAEAEAEEEVAPAAKEAAKEDETPKKRKKAFFPA
jgi:hypothetical protein